MSNRSGGQANDDAWLHIPRLQLALILVAWGLGAISALGGLVIVGHERFLPLIALIVAALLFNLLLVWLDRSGVSEGLIGWGAHLGNLALMTAGVHLTGGFRSPFFSLYAIYLVAAGLGSGWRGLLRSFLFCLLSWGVLAILLPPADLQEWAWVGMLVSAFLMICLAVGALADRHARFRAEARRRSEEMAFLCEAGRSLAATLDPQEVLAVTLARVNELIDVEAASLALVDEVTGRIVFEQAVGGAYEAVVGTRLEPGQGIIGHAIQEGHPILVPDVSRDPRWHPGVDLLSGYETRSILCVPLRVEEQIIGGLEALNKRSGPFTENDQRLLSALADLAAQSIENARVHDQLLRSVSRLQEAYTEVQQAAELKSDFVRNVSHELRSPLALIQGYLELLLGGQMGPLQPQQEESLSVIAERSAQLASLVNDIVSMQTVGAMSSDFEVLALGPIIQAVVAEARPGADKACVGLDLELPSAGELPLIKGDARRLHRVFAHLLNIAIRFSPNGGTVRLAIQRKGEMLFVRVRDEGIGLAAGQPERIFERFYKVDASSAGRYGGTGLELTQVKEIVEAHGGSVWAESEGVGRGTTFIVFFPIYQEQQEEGS